MKIEIRKAKLEDFQDILGLNQQIFDWEYENFDKTLDCSWPQRNKDYFKKAIESEDYITIIAIDNKKIVGYLIGRIQKPKDYRNVKKIAEIDNTFILEKYRNKGIGKELFRRFKEWAVKKNMQRITVKTSKKNKGAISFYKKYGFSDYSLILESEL